ncbi:hypothetical protein HYV80_05465 [Candidatus Woesearchaeota archaeon]|nr:hypothetical protein [Candidatus Woesearchaeota archaeon]
MDSVDNRIKKILEKGNSGIYEIVLDEHHIYDNRTYEIIETKTSGTLPQRIARGYYEGFHDEDMFTFKASFLVPLQIPYAIVTNATRLGDLPPKPTINKRTIEVVNL